MTDPAEAAPDREQRDETSRIAFGRTVDWAVGAVLGVFGALVALSGGALYASSSHAVVADVLRNAEFESEVLTEAEAVDVLSALGQWTGLGLAVTGVLLVALGVAVVVAHGRARTAAGTTPAWILGVVGAIVSVGLGFVPFSPVLGGATAGYLDSDPAASGLGPGALAGVVGGLPALLVTVFAGFGLFRGVPGDLAPAAAALLVFTAILTLLYFVALSAIGGYLGGWARKRQSNA